jgi:hypothetical protein
MSNSAWGLLHERSLHDLLDSEREVRMALESEYRKLVALIEKLARRHYGAALEDQRRAAPEAVQSWTAQDWEKFFLKVSKVTQSQSDMSQTINSWSRPAVVGPSQNGNDAEKELALFKKDNQELLKEIDHLQAEGKRQQRKLLQKRSESSKKLGRSISLDAFQMPSVSLKCRDLENKFGSLQWRRAIMILYLMVNFGINAPVELDRYIAPMEGLSFRSNAIKNSAKKLIQVGLVMGDTLRFKRPKLNLDFALWVLRLTDRGRAFCQTLGWQPIESEWERLLRLTPSEEEYHLVMLYLALLGRSRNYQIEILPEVAGETQADARLHRGTEDMLVVVELNTRTDITRWQNLYQQQGIVGICTLDVTRRESLSNTCQQARIPGKATDLETLKAVKIYETSANDPLWLAEWQ